MPDQHDLISAFARKWGVAPEALEALLTQIRASETGRASDDGETALFVLETDLGEEINPGPWA